MDYSIQKLKKKRKNVPIMELSVVVVHMYRIWLWRQWKKLSEQLILYYEFNKGKDYRK
jgi:hypothetical protein